MPKPVLPIIDLEFGNDDMLRDCQAHLLQTLNKHFTVQIVTCEKQAKQLFQDKSITVVISCSHVAAKWAKSA